MKGNDLDKEDELSKPWKEDWRWFFWILKISFFNEIYMIIRAACLQCSSFCTDCLSIFFVWSLILSFIVQFMTHTVMITRKTDFRVCYFV